jgi:hypothetical protein
MKLSIQDNGHPIDEEDLSIYWASFEWLVLGEEVRIYDQLNHDLIEIISSGISHLHLLTGQSN